MTPTAVRGCSPWMEWLPKLVSTFYVFDAGKDCAVLDEGRAEGEGVKDAFCDEGLGVGAGFVVDFGGAVGVEG